MQNRPRDKVGKVDKADSRCAFIFVCKGRERRFGADIGGVKWTKWTAKRLFFAPINIHKNIVIQIACTAV